MRRRSCPSLQRVPAPARFVPIVPWRCSSGNGPTWHSRHRPTCRLVTIARPRTASPGVAVSGAGIASPTTRYAATAADCAMAVDGANSTDAASAQDTPARTRAVTPSGCVSSSGRSRMRLPVAAKIAFSTAGAATAIVGSPTPPQKPPDGIDRSSRPSACRSMRSDRVVVEVGLLDAAVLDRARAEQRGGQAVRERALDLRLDLLRIDGVPGVGRRDDAMDLQHAVLAHRDLGARAAT